MKIAIIGTKGLLSQGSGAGGVEKAVQEVACRFVRDGHQVTVYCRTVSLAEQQEGLRLIFIPAIKSKHFGTALHVLLSAVHACFTDADIVHFHSLGPSLFSLLPRLFFKKTVVTIHSLDWKRKKWSLPARLVLRLCAYSAIYFPNRTVAISRTLKEYFETRFKRKVIFIPNGAPLNDEPLKEASSDSGRPYILFVGRLVPEKRIERLLSAFSELGGTMRLFIVGEPSFTADYAALLRRLSSPHVEFLGFVQGARLKELYQKAYLFVLPSDVEGASLSLLEAMGYGRCVLVSDIPESRELVGENGFFFATDSPDDLKNKLRFLIDNPRVVAQTGARAKKHVRACYDWEKIAQKTEELYRSL